MPGLDKPPPDTGFNPQQNSENPYVSIHFFFLISKVRNVSIHGKYCRKGYPPTTFSAISAAIPKFLRKFASS